MIGAILGITGCMAQFFLLKKLVNIVTSGKKFNVKIILCIAAQIPLPVCILLLCALFFREQLIYCGIGMAGMLLLLSIITFIVHMGKESKK